MKYENIDFNISLEEEIVKEEIHLDSEEEILDLLSNSFKNKIYKRIKKVKAEKLLGKLALILMNMSEEEYNPEERYYTDIFWRMVRVSIEKLDKICREIIFEILVKWVKEQELKDLLIYTNIDFDNDLFEDEYNEEYEKIYKEELIELLKLDIYKENNIINRSAFHKKMERVEEDLIDVANIKEIIDELDVNV